LTGDSRDPRSPDPLAAVLTGEWVAILLTNGGGLWSGGFHHPQGRDLPSTAATSQNTGRNTKGNLNDFKVA
jgi:hypothetical protein